MITHESWPKRDFQESHGLVNQANSKPKTLKIKHRFQNSIRINVLRFLNRVFSREIKTKSIQESPRLHVVRDPRTEKLVARTKRSVSVRGPHTNAYNLLNFIQLNWFGTSWNFSDMNKVTFYRYFRWEMTVILCFRIKPICTCQKDRKIESSAR